MGKRIKPITDVPDDFLLRALGVQQMLGGVHRSTLHRWTNDADMAFPAPDMMIKRFPYWRAGTVRAWIAARAEKEKAQAARDRRAASRPPAKPASRHPRQKPREVGACA